VRIAKIMGIGLLACSSLVGVLLGVQSVREPADVSLIQLIGNPDKYDGKSVRVIGFLRLEFEGDALYLHQEDFEHALTKNAIWVNAGPGMTKNRERLDKKYVLLE
jgi:hypothetical protein